MKKTAFPFLVGVYFLLTFFYSIFSFSLTDPNLILSSWSPYWQFQNWMWLVFFHNAHLLTWTYVGLVLGVFATYVLLLEQVHHFTSNKQVGRKLVVAAVVVALPFFFSYNALSHDVFNYIFNAKMVLVYHANPHQQVALDFAQDDWTRFMHNTNTPAPYGYGWTVISLLPSIAGFGKFFPTWMLFRAFSIASVLALFFAIKHFARTYAAKKLSDSEFTLLFFNPLFLIEVISNSHNDLWMMASAVASLALLFDRQKNGREWRFFVSAALLIFSISMKLATALLIPVWLLLLLQMVVPNLFILSKNLQERISTHVPEIAVFLLFLPLLTARSQQFNPWYLTWLLVWLPFIQWRWLKNALLVLTLSSLLRYCPWLWNGGFSDEIVRQQKMITWVPLAIWLGGEAVLFLSREISRWHTPSKPSKMKK
jgi:hypothetical protein